MFKRHRATAAGGSARGMPASLDLDPLHRCRPMSSTLRQGAVKNRAIDRRPRERFLVERDTFGATAPRPTNRREPLAVHRA